MIELPRAALTTAVRDAHPLQDVTRQLVGGRPTCRGGRARTWPAGWPAGRARLDIPRDPPGQPEPCGHVDHELHPDERRIGTRLRGSCVAVIRPHGS
jgi:hypothetical protein